MVQTKYNHGKRNITGDATNLHHTVDLERSQHQHEQQLLQSQRQYQYQQTQQTADSYDKYYDRDVVYDGGDEVELNSSSSPVVPIELVSSSSMVPKPTQTASQFGVVDSSSPEYAMTDHTELELVQSDQSFISRFKRNSRKELQIAVLAPEDPTYQYSLQRILPPISMAVTSKRIAGLLPGWKIEVRHRDTQCSSTYGPLAAFDFYINKTAGQSPVLSEYVHAQVLDYR